MQRTLTNGPNRPQHAAMLAMYNLPVHRQHWEAVVSVTQIDLDDEALAEIMRIAGVHTKKEAVNLAMRDYVERFRRIEALARSREQAKDWDYEAWLAARAEEKAAGA
jgi:Arc/MetJ family transcription regulator